VFSQINENNFNTIYNRPNIKACFLDLKFAFFKNDDKNYCYSNCPYDYSLMCFGGGYNESFHKKKQKDFIMIQINYV